MKWGEVLVPLLAGAASATSPYVARGIGTALDAYLGMRREDRRQTEEDQRRATRQSVARALAGMVDPEAGQATEGPSQTVPVTDYLAGGQSTTRQATLPSIVSQPESAVYGVARPLALENPEAAASLMAHTVQSREQARQEAARQDKSLREAEERQDRSFRASAARQAATQAEIDARSERARRESERFQAEQARVGREFAASHGLQHVSSTTDAEGKVHHLFFNPYTQQTVEKVTEGGKAADPLHQAGEVTSIQTRLERDLKQSQSGDKAAWEEDRPNAWQRWMPNGFLGGKPPYPEAPLASPETEAIREQIGTIDAIRRAALAKVPAANVKGALGPLIAPTGAAPETGGTGEAPIGTVINNGKVRMVKNRLGPKGWDPVP